ncbi:MAG: response regulator, partial [Rubripirellula sp.]
LAEDLESALIDAGETVAMVDGINVLVVEDSRTDMLFTIEMLRKTNPTLSIQQARSLEEGLQICREMPIDLVLLDLSLPDSSGVATVGRFREQFGSVPLVVLTGLSQDEAGEECLEAGADTFVSKSGLSAHRMERAIFVTLSRCDLTGNT